MLFRLTAIVLFIIAPSMLSAALSKEECLQIEALVATLPAECIAAAAASPGLASGIPLGEIWQNHVFFPAGGTALDAQAVEKLKTLSMMMQGKVLGFACLQLIGHSDTSGGAVANQRLGQLRAEKVAQFLGALLQDTSRIESHISLGETKPLANRAPSDKWQRRVEIRARQCLGM